MSLALAQLSGVSPPTWKRFEMPLRTMTRHRDPCQPAETRDDDTHDPRPRLTVLDRADGREGGDEEEELGADPDANGEDMEPRGDGF